MAGVSIGKSHPTDSLPAICTQHSGSLTQAWIDVGPEITHHADNNRCVVEDMRNQDGDQGIIKMDWGQTLI